MQILQTAPDGWPAERVDAFNTLASACLAYKLYADTLTALAINDPVLNQRRTDLGNLIKNELGPAFRNT